MKKGLFFSAVALLAFTSPVAYATQADDTTITIDNQTAGVTPFINQLTLSASDTSVIKNIQFTITPKPASVTRPLSGTYSNEFLTERGYLLGDGTIFLPVYGLYAGFTNEVTLTYYFNDGSSKADATMVPTAPFDDPCGYETPTVVQARTDNTSLSYDFIMIKGQCSSFSPAIMDTDAALRWVGPAGLSSFKATFFDNAVYIGDDSKLYRIELDGTVTFLHDYVDIGVTMLHHNFDRGKNGIILDVDTTSQIESINIEVDAAGNLLRSWDLAAIISAAMTAGGDDPSQFVYPAPNDWFHNNAAAYDRAHDALIVSSRENFVISIDYETRAINWILGDPTKKWYQFPSLRQFALELAPGSLPPIGQHAVSVTYDEGLLLLDNGFNSSFQDPPGENRPYTSPRKYLLDLTSKTATEVWNYEQDQSVISPICGSTYEDAPLNYLIDYAYENGFGATTNYGRLLGLDASGEKVFDYRYETVFCNEIFNATPVHFENLVQPTVGPQALNLSTRGLIGDAEESLIGGFIITGTTSKNVILRALGPSLTDAGVAGAASDPALTVYDSAGSVIAINDDWQSDPGAAEITAEGLAPSDPAEAATLQSLAPGEYTVVVTGKDSPGIGLVETYDLNPTAGSELANISTRGSVASGDNVLITGFIIGDVASSTVVLRALGPSLAGVLDNPLPDPSLTVYDANGSSLASNDNWQDDVNFPAVAEIGLPPDNLLDSALVLFLPAGAYSGIVTSADGGTGVALAEIYNIP